MYLTDVLALAWNVLSPLFNASGHLLGCSHFLWQHLKHAWEVLNEAAQAHGCWSWVLEGGWESLAQHAFQVGMARSGLLDAPSEKQCDKQRRRGLPRGTWAPAESTGAAIWSGSRVGHPQPRDPPLSPDRRKAERDEILQIYF